MVGGEGEQLSPKSARLTMRRAASSARSNIFFLQSLVLDHYNTISQPDEPANAKKVRLSVEKGSDSITPRQ